MTENSNIPDKYKASLAKLDAIAHGEWTPDPNSPAVPESKPITTIVRLSQTNPFERHNLPSKGEDKISLERANKDSTRGMGRVVKMGSQKSIFEK